MNVYYVLSRILAFKRNLLPIALVGGLVEMLFICWIWLLFFILKKLIFLLLFYYGWLAIRKRMDSCIVFTGNASSSFMGYCIWCNRIVILSSPSNVLIGLIILVSHINSMGGLILLWEVIAVVILYNLFPCVDIVFDLVIFRHFALFQENQK